METRPFLRFTRVLALALLAGLAAGAQAFAQTDPLPSWNDGPTKKAILEFVRKVTDKDGPDYSWRRRTASPPSTTMARSGSSSRCTRRSPSPSTESRPWSKHPEWKDEEPFKTILAGDREAMAKLSMKDLEKILVATLTGMTVEQFAAEAKDWLATAKHPRFKRPYTELVYQPMLEVMRYLRANGYKTYIVTGGGQDFVRVYAEQVYGMPPEQVIGTAGGTKYLR